MLVQSGRKSDSQRRNTDQSQAGLGVPSDLQSMAREEGEGMETTETESLSPAGTPLTSLEHLLMSPNPKQGTFERRAPECLFFLPASLVSELILDQFSILNSVCGFFFRAICVECRADQRGTHSEAEHNHTQSGTHEQPAARD